MSQEKSPAKATGRPPIQTEGKVGVRGCWELILKIIIALVITALFIAYWLNQPEAPPWIWLLLLLLVSLLIWLIWRQKHFVFLNCDLTEPTGCKHGDPNLLTGYVLEPIIGTAAGIGFSRYELEVLWNGTTTIADGVIYADVAGNPVTSLTTGNHQVNNDVLGFVDIQKVVLGAGTGILTSTDFEVRLRVIGIDNSSKPCAITFSLVSARAYIKFIGGGWAHDVTDVNEILRRADNIIAEEVPVGGRISVRGAADAYGCNLEKISQYSLWIKADPTFSLTQPTNGSVYDPVAGGWTNITTVTYTTNAQHDFNTLDGMPNPDYLTNQSVWGTRTICIYPDFMPPVCFPVPDLKEFKWNSDPSGPPTGSGKYSFLLKVEDTAANTYYDLQRAWIDNEVIRGKIDGIGVIGACEDIYILDLPGTVLPIEGYATDPLIDSGDTTMPTSDNFKEYKMWFQKQGAVGWVPLDIPLAGGSLPTLSDTSPVPDRATWSGGPVDPPVGALAEWDLGWLDAAINPQGLAADQLLAEGESCTYNLRLEVWDKTIVHEVYPHWTGTIVFPVKVHNGSAPSP